MRRGLIGKRHIYRKSPWKWMLLVGMKHNLYKETVPVAERYIRSVPLEGLAPDNKSAELTIPDSILTRIHSEIKIEHLAGQQYIALCPGAKHASKQYPEEHQIALCRKLLEIDTLKIVIVGGAEEKAIGDTLSGISPDRIRNFCGAMSLLESAAAIKTCDSAITNDSGLMHIATAVGTPVVALFGSTVREFGFFPYNAPASVLEVDGLHCRPCTHIGKKSCPKGHFKCMNEIQPDAVVKAVIAHLASDNY
jgi:lipopolysaccharide heptosyltransferase II